MPVPRNLRSCRGNDADQGCALMAANLRSVIFISFLGTVICGNVARADVTFVPQRFRVALYQPLRAGRICFVVLPPVGRRSANARNSHSFVGDGIVGRGTTDGTRPLDRCVVEVLSSRNSSFTSAPRTWACFNHSTTVSKSIWSNWFGGHRRPVRVHNLWRVLAS